MQPLPCACGGARAGALWDVYTGDNCLGKWRYDLLTDQLVKDEFVKSAREAYWQSMGVPVERGVAHNRWAERSAGAGRTHAARRVKGRRLRVSV
jgi:hypothetical protein